MKYIFGIHKVQLLLQLTPIVNDNYKAIISIMCTVFWLTDE